MFPHISLLYYCSFTRVSVFCFNNFLQKRFNDYLMYYLKSVVIQIISIFHVYCADKKCCIQYVFKVWHRNFPPPEFLAPLVPTAATPSHLNANTITLKSDKF